MARGKRARMGVETQVENVGRRGSVVRLCRSFAGATGSLSGGIIVSVAGYCKVARRVLQATGPMRNVRCSAHRLPSLNGPSGG